MKLLCQGRPETYVKSGDPQGSQSDATPSCNNLGLTVSRRVLRATWVWSAPILWLSDVKSWLIRKDTDAEKDWRQEEKGITEDEMAGWHHRLDGHEFAQSPGVGDGQGSLGCCSPWGHKESDMTERLNWTEQVKTMVSYWPVEKHRLTNGRKLSQEAIYTLLQSSAYLTPKAIGRNVS